MQYYYFYQNHPSGKLLAVFEAENNEICIRPQNDMNPETVKGDQCLLLSAVLELNAEQYAMEQSHETLLTKEYASDYVRRRLLDISENFSKTSNTKNKVKKKLEKLGLGMLITANWFLPSGYFVSDVQPEDGTGGLLQSFLPETSAHWKQTVRYGRCNEKWEPVWESEIAMTVGTEQAGTGIERLFLNQTENSLIIGPGGVGKTELLKQIYIQGAAVCQKKVYPIKLAHLLMQSAAHPISTSKYAESISESGGRYADGSYSSYILQYLRIPCVPQEEAFFLLDGLNEMADMTTNENSAAAAAIYAEIRDLCRNPHIGVILTSRLAESAKKLGDVKPTLYQPDLLREELPEDAFGHCETGEQRELIRSLLRRPLFYKMYQELGGALPPTQYDLMQKFFQVKYRQSVAQKDGQDRFEQRCLYYLLLPLIAHKMHAKRIDYYNAKELRLLLNRLNNDENRTEIIEWLNFCLEQSDLNNTEPLCTPGFLSIPDKLLTNAKNTDFLLKEDDCFAFSHQEWKHFFGEYYVITYLAFLKYKYENASVSGAMASPLLMPVFNLPTDVQETISAQTGIYPAKNNPKDDPLIGRENQTRADAFAAFFPEIQLRTESYMTADGFRERISDCIQMLYTVYEMYDHFRLHHYHAMKAIAGAFCDQFMALSEEYDPREYLSKDRLLRYAKTLTALTECARRDKDYARVYLLYRFAMEQLGIEACRNSRIGESMLTFGVMQNQYAKAMLFESRALSQTDPAKARQQLRTAIQLLKANIRCNMSANLLGCMYATPNRYLRGIGMRPDPVKAAEVYERSFSAMTEGALFTLTGTELQYTGRQLVNLMMKGYLLYGGRQDAGEPAWKANTEYCLPDAVTLEKTAAVLRHLEGQHAAFLNWDRAMHLIFSATQKQLPRDVQKTASDLLETEEANMMTMLLRLSNIPPHAYCGSGCKVYYENKRKTDRSQRLEQKLLRKIDETAANIGKAEGFDATDSYYYLQDLEQLCRIILALADEDVKQHRDNEALPHTEAAQKVLDKLQKLKPYQAFREQIAAEPFCEEE